MRDFTISAPLLYALLTLAGMLLVSILHRTMNDESNPLSYWQFIATRNDKGEYVADGDKLMKFVGGITGSWVVIKCAVADDVAPNFLGLAAVLGAYFSFLAGAAGWAAYLRSKQETKP